MDIWIEIEVRGTKTQSELRSGLTRVGAAGTDVVIDGFAEGELHFWSDPPKAVYAGGGPVPLGPSGAAFDELDLVDGMRLQWGGAGIVFRRPQAVIEEIPLSEPAASAPPPRVAPALVTPVASVSSAARPVSAPVSGDARVVRRLQAGVLAELGLADRDAIRRWQEAVQRGAFDPDACARDVLDTATVPSDDSRVVQRSASLERDLLMAPLARGAQGAARRARTAAKSGTAFFVVQGLALLVYSVLVAVVLVLVRARWDLSVDGWIDALVGR